MSGRVWRVLAASVLVTAVMGPIVARPAEAVTTRVTMADMKFTPDHLEVQLGDTVVWLAGDDDHTVTARDGSFDSSSRGLMGQGDEFRWRFRVPGQFAYYCRIHGSRGMQGVITVVDPSAATTTPTRVLATSSTTNPAQAVTATAPPGVPAVPQEPPALNLGAPVLGSGGNDGGLPEAQTASHRAGGSSPLPAALGIGGAAVLAVLGAGVAVKRRGSRARRG